MTMSSQRPHGSIFISYRREDTDAYAGRLYDRLSDTFGEDRVFMDVDSIAFGVDFTRAVKEAVSGCDILLALVGRDWLDTTDNKGRRRVDNPDDWVRIEIETALQRDIRVVPVLVDGAVLPKADDLPSSLRPLVRRQALELSHASFRSEVTRLIAAVDEVLGPGMARSAEAPKSAARVSATLRERWRLELVDSAQLVLGVKYTFHLSSGKETHVITVQIAYNDTIEVDGELIVKKSMGVKGKEFPLNTLSSSLGANVTIKFTYPIFDNKLKCLTIRIGDQFLQYPCETS
jgi:TIR domain